MGKIIINQNKVTYENAQEAIKICPFGAIEYQNNKLDINSACKMCKLCVRKGPAGVFEFVEEQVKAIDKNEWQGVSVFVEHNNDKIHPVVFELIGKAKELVKVTKQKVYAVLFTDDAKKFEDEILSYGVDKLYVYEHQEFAHFHVEKYASAMEDFIKKIKPSVILYGGTSIGRSFAPRIASRFKTGLTADCTILGMKENTDLIQNRPAFGGNIMAGIICPNNRPQMATVRYKIFKMPAKEKPHGEIVRMGVDQLDLSSNMKLLAVKPKDSSVDISEAEIIVAIGRPFKTAEDIALAKKLADLLGAEMASTRPLIEIGLMDPRKQIGLSGRTVAPKLLITLGISGAVQFAAGMKGSQVVFSVCNDKNASIFDIAHYGVVGDVFKILPKLISEVKVLKGLV
ncbi:MAG TPA: FAD-binding protein [Bacilli bacterium]|nr:FAD-binding protein [Bacilli bacterium]HQO00570.1 FAD-binding protein [Bacilli bacterium]